MVTVKIHVELIKLASGVVKRGMTAKAAKKIRCVKIVKVIKCHPQSNLPAGKKEKEILKVKTERIVNIYNVPKPNMPSYAPALKSL